MKLSKQRGTATDSRSAVTSALWVFLMVGALALYQPISNAFAFPNPAPVNLASSGAFSVLAGSTVTNTGPTVISADPGVGGNLGVSPGTAVTGFPPGVVTPPGTIHAGDSTAATAQTDAGTAYNDAAGRAPDVIYPPVHDLGGETLTAGVYNDPSSLALTGALTLDGEGNPDAVFIFQAGSTLVTSASSKVLLTNGARACHVFWQVGSSATLGATSVFNGTILALTSVTVGDSVNIEGRVLAGSGAVTLGNDAIHTPDCASGAASVSIEKVADEPSVYYGDTIGFNITVTSTGTATALGVQVSDPLPTDAGTSWSIDGGTGAGDCSILLGILGCDFGDMIAGSNLTVHISSPTTKATVADSPVVNTATVTTDNAGSAESTDQVEVICQRVNLSVTADASVVQAGSIAGFTVKVTRVAVGVVQGVQLTSLLPKGLVWTLDGGSGQSMCSVSGSTLSCSFGDMSQGMVYTAHVSAVTAKTGALTYKARVFGPNPLMTKTAKGFIRVQ